MSKNTQLGNLVNGIFVDSTGRVGVGTESPTELLVLSKATYPTIKLIETTASAQGYFQYHSVNSYFILNAQSNHPLLFGTNDTERVRITSAGLVGIGTSSPSYALTVSAATGTNVTPQINAVNTTLNGYGILRLTGNSRGGIIDFYDNSTAQASITGQGGAFYVYTNGNSSGTPKFTITSAGNISFGSTTASQSEINNNHNAVGQGLYWGTANNTSYADWIFNAKCERTNSSSYGFFRSISGGGDIEHLLRGDGNAYADASWNGGGADYAEYFEWEDGNINNETRTGMSVSLSNGKIKVAENNEVVIGVVSANPSMVGDTAFNKWEGKYLKDEFNSYLRDENGERILNPLFDESQEYIPREQRKEWAVIGLVGKLRIKKGQKIGSSWIKIKDISSEVEEWLVK